MVVINKVSNGDNSTLFCFFLLQARGAGVQDYVGGLFCPQPKKSGRGKEQDSLGGLHSPHSFTGLDKRSYNINKIGHTDN